MYDILHNLGKGKRIIKPKPVAHNYYNAEKAELLQIQDSDYEASSMASFKHYGSNQARSEYGGDAYNISEYRAPLPLAHPTTGHSFKHQPEPENDGKRPAALGIDYNKKSVGMLTTTPHDDRVKVMEKVNQKSQYISPLQPMAAYIGKKPDPRKDPYDRRKVKQLDDISFESDDEPEEIKNLRRLPDTILTEESLKVQLSSSLRCLKLDNHFWIKNNFIDKIGRMAPNLVELSIRGLKVDSQSFIDMVKHMALIKILDISNCRLLDETAIMALADTNKAIVQFRASGCRNAITDASLTKLVQESKTEFEIMDISY